LREVHWTRTKIAFISAFVGGLMLLGGIELNQRNGDPVGLGIVRNSGLLQENRVLREQLRFVTGRIQKLQASLADLGDQGDELRLRLDLPRLDTDILKVGMGGTDDRVDVGLSSDVSSMVNDLHRMIGRAERELHLQSESYRIVEHKFESDKNRFARMPAVKPMDGYYTKSFGMRLHPILGIYRPHQGIDIINDVGTSVYASADGVVNFTGRESGLGNTITLGHGYSTQTIYGHLSKILIREGQQVRRGQLIALSGNTGLSSGPHLHYEVRVNGTAQNPIDYFFDDVLRVAQQR
jgi:murein DD-endopeptidase MepM/ murein hydrolase activator NlpD